MKADKSSSNQCSAEAWDDDVGWNENSSSCNNKAPYDDKPSSSIRWVVHGVEALEGKKRG